MHFPDRAAAGRELARRLADFRGEKVLVFGLARGGVIVAAEVAKFLSAPLDTLVVRKLGAPLNPEFAFGALAPENTVFLDQETVANLRLDQNTIAEVIENEKSELTRREKLYRGERKFPQLKGVTVIVVDDGIATGATTRAALQFLHKKNPARIILAVPVAAVETLAGLESLCDKIICLHTPKFLGAVGAWYENFPQTSDAEVVALLR